MEVTNDVRSEVLGPREPSMVEIHDDICRFLKAMFTRESNESVASEGNEIWFGTTKFVRIELW